MSRRPRRSRNESGKDGCVYLLGVPDRRHRVDDPPAWDPVAVRISEMSSNADARDGNPIRAYDVYLLECKLIEILIDSTGQLRSGCGSSAYPLALLIAMASPSPL